jgi:hypothetical protein
MLTLLQVKIAIKNRQSFKTNNIEAFQGFHNGKTYYSIKSYDTLIYNELTGLDNTFYSVTTSKLQNMIREAFNIEKPKSKREVKNFDIKLNNVKINTSVFSIN